MNDSLDIRNICLQCSQDMLDQTIVLQHVAERNNEAIPGLVITDVR